MAAKVAATIAYQRKTQDPPAKSGMLYQLSYDINNKRTFLFLRERSDTIIFDTAKLLFLWYRTTTVVYSGLRVFQYKPLISFS